MRVLILGGSGMLGHKLFQVLGQRSDVWVSFRELNAGVGCLPYQHAERNHLIGGVDAANVASVERAIDQVNPDAVVNGIGIVKQRDEAKQAVPSILINTLFPQQLAELCERKGIRMVHVSTDCVFSGRQGRYTEADIPDPVDLYGRSKLLGEPARRGCLVLRTSIIGWELKNRVGLLEWFAAQRGTTIKGYRNAIYSGLSTTVLANVIGDVLVGYPGLEGLYQVASAPISKYALLAGMREALRWNDITIQPDDNFHCDRSLDGTRFEAATRWKAPGWDSMIDGLAAEWDSYAQWRNQPALVP